MFIAHSAEKVGALILSWLYAENYAVYFDFFD